MQLNLLDDDGWLERTWPPERPGFVWRRKRLAPSISAPASATCRRARARSRTTMSSATTNCSSWSVGVPRCASPDGERQLAAGDCVLFPSEPEGAHQLTNRSHEPTRVLLVSNFALSRAAVRVDSNKMTVRWVPGRRDERRWFFLGEEAEYWDGEAAPHDSDARERRPHGGSDKTATGLASDGPVRRSSADTMSTLSRLSGVTQSSIA
jgi:hypothetical protein